MYVDFNAFRRLSWIIAHDYLCISTRLAFNGSNAYFLDCYLHSFSKVAHVLCRKKGHTNKITIRLNGFHLFQYHCFLFALRPSNMLVYVRDKCSGNCTCCHTEIQVVDQPFHLTQSEYADTWPTSPDTNHTPSRVAIRVAILTLFLLSKCE